MMGTTGGALKGIMKEDARFFSGGNVIREYAVMCRIEGGVEVTHENGRDGVGSLRETFQDEFGAECLNGGRKIKMGIDTGQFVRHPLECAYRTLPGPLTMT